MEKMICIRIDIKTVEFQSKDIDLFIFHNIWETFYGYKRWFYSLGFLIFVLMSCFFIRWIASFLHYVMDYDFWWVSRSEEHQEGNIAGYASHFESNLHYKLK